MGYYYQFHFIYQYREYYPLSAVYVFILLLYLFILVYFCCSCHLRLCRFTFSPGYLLRPSPFLVLFSESLLLHIHHLVIPITLNCFYHTRLRIVCQSHLYHLFKFCYWCQCSYIFSINDTFRVFVSYSNLVYRPLLYTAVYNF